MTADQEVQAGADFAHDFFILHQFQFADRAVHIGIGELLAVVDVRCDGGDSDGGEPVASSADMPGQAEGFHHHHHPAGELALGAQALGPSHVALAHLHHLLARQVRVVVRGLVQQQHVLSHVDLLLTGRHVPSSHRRSSGAGIDNLFPNPPHSYGEVPL